MPNILAQKAVIASLNIRAKSWRMLDKQVTDEVNTRHNAQADAGRYNKLLLHKSAFAELDRVEYAARAKFALMTMPWSKAGNILPSALYGDFADVFRGFREEYGNEAATFVKRYPEHIEAAKPMLKGMFKSEDYPTPDRVRRAYSFDVSIHPVPDINDFRTSLAKEQMDDIKSNLQTELEEKLQDAMKEPVRRIVDVVGKMTERLNSYRPKTETNKAENTFRDSLVGNIRELIPLLNVFNLTNDKTLTALTKRMEKELCRHEGVVLREDELVRKNVAEAAEAILKDAQALLA